MMLEYIKTILQKVSFDTKLFAKELSKGISWLVPNEIEELKTWLHSFTSDKPQLRSLIVLLKSN